MPQGSRGSSNYRSAPADPTQARTWLFDFVNMDTRVMARFKAKRCDLAADFERDHESAATYWKKMRSGNVHYYRLLARGWMELIEAPDGVGL